MHPTLVEGHDRSVISRRSLLGAVGAASVTLAAGAAFGAGGVRRDDKAEAARKLGVPMPAPAKPATENAGVYRRVIGSSEVFAISDGTSSMPGSPFPLWGANVGKEKVDAALKRDLLPAEGLAFYFNVTLIRHAGMTVLVDTGNKGGGPDAGKLVARLAQIGVTPDMVDAVVFSHLHPDHFGATIADDGTSLTFAKARYFVHKNERDFWTTATPADIKGQIPDGFKQGMVKGAGATLAAIKSRIEVIDGPHKLADGLTIEPLPGHTPGHQTVRLASGAESLLVMADAVHHPSLSFRDPSMHIQFDYDPAIGAANRAKFVERAADEGTLCLGYHMPFPAIGKVSKEGEGTYRWVPEGWKW